MIDVYTVFKFLHVLSAIAWVGGGVTLLANSLFTIADKGETEVLHTLQIMDGLAKRWFIPTSMLTLVFGAIATTFGGLWTEPWVLLGLAGFAATFVTGMTVFEPLGKRIAQLVAANQHEAALVKGRTLLRIAKFDYTVMLVVIADMVFKPYWTDFAVLGLFALALAGGAFFFLLGGKFGAPGPAASVQ